MWIHSNCLRGHVIDIERLRYRTLIFWVYANPPLLEQRLDERVNQMIKVWDIPFHADP